MATVACDNEEGLISVMYDSPLGPIRISADLDGIVEVNLQFGGKYLSKLSKVQTTAASQRRCLTLEQLSSCSDGGYQLVHIRNCVKWFDVYFKGDFDQLKNVVFPQLKPLLSDDELGFNCKIWKALVQVEVGCTVSYQQLAVLATGNPMAARAAGNAVRSHNIPILIPCHRVVKSGGAIGSYSGGNGTDTKQWLLKHEHCNNI